MPDIFYKPEREVIPRSGSRYFGDFSFVIKPGLNQNVPQQLVDYLRASTDPEILFFFEEGVLKILSTETNEQIPKIPEQTIKEDPEPIKVSPAVVQKRKVRTES